MGLPLSLTGGYALGSCYEFALERNSRPLRILSVAVLLVSVCFSAYQAIMLSFFRYDDDTSPYSYAHTRRDFLGLVNDVQRIEHDNNLVRPIGITVMSPEYWPLPWYFRDNTNIAYEAKVVDTTQPLIIALDSQMPELEKQLGTSYRRISSHELRPGVMLVLYLRRDLVP